MNVHLWHKVCDTYYYNTNRIINYAFSTNYRFNYHLYKFTNLYLFFKMLSIVRMLQI